MKTEKRRA